MAFIKHGFLYTLLLLCIWGPFGTRAQTGLPDLTFNPLDTAAYIQFPVMAALCQPDGKIIIAGGEGFGAAELSRYLPDGRFDSSFITGTGFDHEIDVAAQQPDGKILAGGLAQTYNGLPFHGLARINSNGSLDTGFHMPEGIIDSRIMAIAIQPDGKILAAGSVLARFLPDGSPDTGFQVVHARAWPNLFLALALQPDGKILVSGTELLRLNSNGTIDTSFKTGSGPDPAASLQALLVQPDGKIIIAGTISTYAGHRLTNMARLYPNGSLDSSFRTPTAVQYISALLLQPDGKLIVGNYDNRFLARLNTDGSEDHSFNMGTAFGLPIPGFRGRVVGGLAQQQDGRIIIGGDFDSYNGTPRRNLLRIKQDGSLDSAFRIGSSVWGWVSALAEQRDRKIVVAGSIYSYYGIDRNIMVRLYPNGELDSSFAPLLNGDVYAMRLQPDQHMIIGGVFNAVNGAPASGIARLHPDGSIDTSFHSGRGFATDTPIVTSPFVRELLLQRDGHIIATGYFRFYNGYPCTNIVRLDSRGRIDTGFHWPLAPLDMVSDLTEAADGKVLFRTTLSGHRNGPKITRLNANGSIDVSFHPSNYDGWTVSRMMPQPDGKMVIGMYNNNSSTRVIRLLPDGAEDNSFAPMTDKILCMQPDGKMLYQLPTAIGRLTRDGNWDTVFHQSRPYNFTIGAAVYQHDDKILLGGSAQYFYNMPVKNGLYRLQNCMVVLSPHIPDTATYSTVYNDSIYWQQPDTGIVLSMSAGGLPPGLNLNRHSGRITGTPVQPGLYSFTVSAGNGRCEDSYTYSIYVKAKDTDIANHGLIVYPIPTTDLLHISFGNAAPGDYDIALYDMPGQVVLRSKAQVTTTHDEAVYDLRHMAAGMYLLRISNASQNFVFKLEKLQP